MNQFNIKKMVLTAMLACLGYVLSTFVSFPRMAPFQHMINVIAAVLLGLIWGFLCALITGLMRMALNGSTILAVIGAVIGAFLSGLLYQLTKKPIMAVIGEVIGTGIISAIVAYPFMVIFYGLPDASIFTYVPFFIPSSLMGACLGYALVLTLKKTGMLGEMQRVLVHERDR